MAKSKSQLITITNSTRKPTPRLPFSDIAKTILGSDYELSLVFIGDRRAQNLNLQYRQKNTKANVLSFPLEKTAGEIFINLAKATREHHKFSLPYVNYVAYLFIHGLFHLKGYDHSSTMESEESKVMKKFNLHGQAHRHRS